nr:immunoglobulin light chain junction region [Macaca mulatta]MOX29476.1 immunoglobulin light chain junction region [Macaca mulatta]MOX31554.1 immunoglobulin light chain junction region [Macaca mulatta]MOX32182.1 immunoglobulin light chain junction region [Macaca mulatta]
DYYCQSADSGGNHYMF